MHYSLRTEYLRNVSISSSVAAIGSSFRHSSDVAIEAAYAYFCGCDGLCSIGSLCAGFVCVYPLQTALVEPICLGKHK